MDRVLSGEGNWWGSVGSPHPRGWVANSQDSNASVERPNRGSFYSGSFYTAKLPWSNRWSRVRRVTRRRLAPTTVGHSKRRSSSMPPVPNIPTEISGRSRRTEAAVSSENRGGQITEKHPVQRE